jgi:hypothetical protein
VKPSTARERESKTIIENGYDTAERERIQPNDHMTSNGASRHEHEWGHTTNTTERGDLTDCGKSEQGTEGTRAGKGRSTLVGAATTTDMPS